MLKDDNPQLYKTRKTLLVLAITGISLPVIAFIIYAWVFRSQHIVSEAEKWGQFGDYFGGVLNPIFGLLAVIGLLWTIYQNQRELYLTREELAKSSEALKANNEIALKREKQQAIKEKKDDVFRMIKLIYDEINALLNNKLLTKGSYNIEKGTASLDNMQFKEIFSESFQHKDLIERFLKTEKNKELFGQLCNLLEQLKEYLPGFEELSGDNVVSNYFKKSFFNVVVVLEKIDLSHPEIIKFYKESRHIYGKANITLPSLGCERKG